MGAVQDVLAVRSYQGDAKAGGSFNLGVDIPTTPFDNLAKYTFMQNKDFYERKNKQDDAAALQIADATALDITDTNPEVRSYLEAKQKEFYKTFENGIPQYDINKSNNKDVNEFNQKFNELKQLIKTANASGVKRAAANSLITAETNEKARAKMKELLDVEEKNWLSGGVEQTLKSGKLIQTEFNPKQENFEIPDITSKFEAQSFIVGYNNNKAIKTSFIDDNARWLVADQLSLGQEQLEFKGDPNSPTYATDKIRHELGNIRGDKDIASKATVDNGNKIIDIYKAKRDEYNALTDEEKAKTKPPEKPDYIKKFEEQNKLLIEKNFIKEKQSKLTNTPFTQIRLIDWENGIDASELIFSKSLAKAKDNGIKYEDVGINTGEGRETATLNANIDDANKDRALQWFIARQSKNETSKGVAATITEQGYNPIASIIASIGKVNTPVALSSLSIAQVAALNPNYLDSDGNLTAEAKLKKVSFGTNNNNEFEIFELDKNGKAAIEMSETKILSNASSYLGRTGSTERKGQDVYSYVPQAFINAIGKKVVVENKKQDKNIKISDADKKKADELMNKYSTPQ